MALDTVERQDGAVAGYLEDRELPALASDRARRRVQPAPRQVGQHRAHREVSFSRDRSGRVENLVVDVQRRSHAGRLTGLIR